MAWLPVSNRWESNTPNQDVLSEHVGLRIGDLDWLAWDSCTITLGIEQACRSAALSVSTVDWANMRAVDIQASEPCTIWIGDPKTPLISGYIDADDLTIGDGSKLRVEVRSRTADIVDCCPSFAKGETGFWNKTKLETIASVLCKPYDITVTCDTDTGDPIPLYRAVPTESVFKALDRLARERGLLLTDDGSGNLHIISIGDVTAPTALLERGRNIKSLSRRRDVTERYASYKVRGQSFEDMAAEAVCQDAWVKRHRLLVLDNEKAATQEVVERRVKWEATTRAGKSVSYEVEVPGWRVDLNDRKSALWAPGMIVRLRDNTLRIDDDLLLTRVELSRSTGNGTTASLSLGYAEGYWPEPNKFKAGAKAKRKKDVGPGITVDPEGEDD